MGYEGENNENAECDKNVTNFNNFITVPVYRYVVYSNIGVILVPWERAASNLGDAQSVQAISGAGGVLAGLFRSRAGS